MFHSIESNETLESIFKGHHLVIPFVTIGNLPQLAVDFLITNFKGKKLGYFETEHVLPIAGDADDSQQCNISVEFYQIPDSDLILMQQRAPPMKNHNQSFAEELVDFIISSQVRDVTFLISRDATTRNDVEITGKQYHSICDPTHVLKQYLTSTDIGEKQTLSLFRERSFAFYMIERSRAKDKFPPLALMMAFCDEGNNIYDGISFAQWFQNGLGDKKQIDKFIMPKSWSLLLDTQTLQMSHQLYT